MSEYSDDDAIRSTCTACVKPKNTPIFWQDDGSRLPTGEPGWSHALSFTVPPHTPVAAAPPYPWGYAPPPGPPPNVEGARIDEDWQGWVSGSMYRVTARFDFPEAEIPIVQISCYINDTLYASTDYDTIAEQGYWMIFVDSSPISLQFTYYNMADEESPARTEPIDFALPMQTAPGVPTNVQYEVVSDVEPLAVRFTLDIETVCLLDRFGGNVNAGYAHPLKTVPHDTRDYPPTEFTLTNGDDDQVVWQYGLNHITFRGVSIFEGAGPYTAPLPVTIPEP